MPHALDLSKDKPCTVSISLEHSEALILCYEDGKDKKQVSYNDVIALLSTSNPSAEDFHEEVYTLLYLEHIKSESCCATQPEPHIEACIERVRAVPEDVLKKYLVTNFPEHLKIPNSVDGHCNLHVVVSIKSGTCQADSFFRNVVKPVLDSLGLLEEQYMVHKTKTDRSVREFTSGVLLPRANQGISQTVLLLSGDGGVVDIINALLQASLSSTFVKPIVGLLAMGTGNALANSSGLNCDASRGLSSFIRGRPESLPTFTARFSPDSELLTDEGRGSERLPIEAGRYGVLHGCVVCSWCLHASLVADSDTVEYRKYGAKRFQMASQELLQPADGSKPHAYKGRVTLFRMNESGREYPEYLDRAEHMYILATFMSNLEKNFRISPRSKPLDGQLRLLHFGILQSDEIMRIIGMAFTDGNHVKEPVVGYQTIEGMRIDLYEPEGRWRRICIDGKIVQVEEGGYVEVRKESHDVLDLVVGLAS